ncbi:PIN domain-containing protein [Bradyrhizobium sp.]|uniref:PIN domain-containing protein n=1 Tax=Bradyrhizobium sp. TaxID=376 RepID=UPI002637478F|nr:PIN domain-containing protein [Bradyrhizobium sp.]
MPVGEPDPRAKTLTVVADVNVLVSAQNANRAGRRATISQRIVGYLTTGSANGTPTQLALSFRMIDTYREVLIRIGHAAAVADSAAQALVEIMRYGPHRLDPYVVFGGTPDPALRDTEDGGVLATAFAARADILVTDNLSDFATDDCESWTTSVAQRSDGSKRNLSCQIHTRPDGRTLMVVHPADFVHWVERGFEISPKSLRAKFSGNQPNPNS